MGYAIEFVEAICTVDGVTPLHLQCSGEETAGEACKIVFSIRLETANGAYSAALPDAQVPDGAAAVTVSYVPPLEWAYDLTGYEKSTGAHGALRALAQVTVTRYAGGAVESSDTAPGGSAEVPAQVAQTLVPTVGAIATESVDGVVPPEWELLVQGRSVLRVSAQSAAGSYGSAICSWHIGQIYSTTGWAELALNSAGTLEIPVSVTDSRGRTASASVTVAVQAYTPPALAEISTCRCDAAGQENVAGSDLLVSAALRGSPLGGKNPLAVTVAYRPAGQAAYEAAQPYSPGQPQRLAAGLAAGVDCEVLYTVADAFASATYQDFVSAGGCALHLRRGGNAVGVGRVAAQPNRLDVELPALLRHGLSVQGTFAVDEINAGKMLAALNTVEQGSILWPEAVFADKMASEVRRWGRLSLFHWKGVLETENGALPAGVQCPAGTLPAGSFTPAAPALFWVVQGGTCPCVWSLSAQGELTFVTGENGNPALEVWGITIVE